jgi:gliding motility-associated-like protein
MSKFLRSFLVFFFFISLSGNGFAQCTSTVDFTGWTRYGDNATPWTVQPNPTIVQSGFSPFWSSFFVGPDTLMNVKITGTIQVNTNDDNDYVGFVFGYKEPLTTGGNGSTHSMEYWLFDWKQDAQTYISWAAPEGMSLCKVDGSFTFANASYFPSFWVHTSSPTFQVVQTNFGPNVGWNDFQVYDFELRLSPTRAMIFIDNVLIFDHTDCFEPGLFGFYEMSQPDVRYSNFQYELYIDFKIENQDVCFGDTAKFTFADTSCIAGNAFTNIDTFYWDLGDGTITNDTNPIHLYTSIDTFNVQLIATDIYGCTDTMSKEVRVNALPEAHFSMTNFCLGDSSVFTDQTQLANDSIASWFWDFGDGVGSSTDTTPLYLYSGAGSYNMTFAIQTLLGCVDTLDTIVSIFDPPTPNFSIQSACDGDTVFFTNTSTQNSFPIASYSWDVQNNQSVDYTTWDAAHLYPTFDIYSVKLELTDTYGCVDSIEKVVDVHPLPFVDFSAPGVCFNVPTQFFDNSVVVNGIMTDWLWILNNGDDTLTTQNPSFQFAQDGMHSVTLIATSDSGCVDQITKNVTVYEIPLADFTSVSSCTNEPMPFTQTATTPFGVVNQWIWDFGNGSSINPNPTHQFNTPGLHAVQLVISTNFGCVDTVVKEVLTYPVPEPLFNWENEVCEGEDLGFFDQSTIAQITPGGDNIVAWNWVMGGLYQFSTQNPVYPSTSASSIKTKLTVTSNYGCSETYETTAKVYPLPEADFDFDIACKDFESAFSSVTSISSGVVNQFRWSFGDTATSTVQNPNHIFQSSGVFDVTFWAASNQSCADSITKQITVPETPEVNFQSIDTVVCSPAEVVLQNLSTISAGNLTYEWFANDAFFGISELPVAKLENMGVEPKSFSIKLTATSAENCVASLVKDDFITVLPAPIADFNLVKDTIEPFDGIVPLANISVNGVKWLWDFDNGFKSTEFQPVYSYEEGGSYLIELKAENIWQCTDSTFKKLVVDPFITMYIPSGFSPNGDGLNDVWEIQGFNENRELALRVYNRWGDLIYFTDDLSKPWDGSDAQSGKLVQGGVYVYKLRFYKGGDEVKEMNGEITVIR